MASAGRIADWWDSQRRETEKLLDAYVEQNPSMFSVAVAATLSTAMEIGAGTVDALRLGEGAAQGTAAGLGTDAMRAVSLVPGAGKVGQLLGKYAKFGKQPMDLIAKCPAKVKAAIAPVAAKVKNAVASIGKTGQGKASQTLQKTCTAGCPISMVTGEELLDLTDFVFDGPVPLRWRRFYRSGHSDQRGALGYGWLTPLEVALEVGHDQVRYFDSEGRCVEIPLPEEGASAANLPEEIRLYREGAEYRVVDGTGVDRIFAGAGGRLRLARLQNSSKASIRIVYDADGRALGLVGSWGRALVVTWAAGRIAGVTPARVEAGRLVLAGSPIVRYAYDAAGDLIRVLDRLDHGERYGYRNHVLVERVMAGGFRLRFEWDRYEPKGRCIRNHGDDGIYDYRFLWEEGGVSRAIDSRGGVASYRHDAQALLVEETSPGGRVTRHAYDERNLRIAVEHPDGAKTLFEHDDAGRVTTITDPTGAVHAIAYDPEGNATALTDPLGGRWSREFEQGRLIAGADPLGAKTEYTYNDLGLLATVTNALGQRRVLIWDESARLAGEIGFDGVKRHFEYDGEDRIVAVVTQDKRVTRYAYDAVGRIAAIRAPDGGTVTLHYDAAGQVTHFTDALGKTTEYRYGNGLSQITARIDANGQALGYLYDAERNLIGLTNPKGERYYLRYDLDENLVEEVGFDGRKQRYEYDAGGRLVASHLVLSAGESGETLRTTRYRRVGGGRLQETLSPDGRVTLFGFDALGRLKAAGTGDSTLTRAYDAVGNLLEERQGDATIGHRYDKLGRRVSTTTPDKHRIDYRYDARGFVERIDFDGQLLTEHRYDELGQEVARRQGGVATGYDYDPMGRLVQQRVIHAAQRQAILGRRYGYQADGSLAIVEDLRRGRTAYQYDPAGQLLQVEGLTAERFVHDPAGNLLGAAGAPARVEGDRLLFSGDRHFGYDAAGNVTEIRRGSGGRQATQFVYDGNDRIVQVNGAAGVVARYRYDALGRRVAKVTADGETRFIWDGDRLLGETSAARGRTYIYEPGTFRPLAMVEGVPERASWGHEQYRVFFYHVDHLGTPQEVTNAQGKVVWSARYRAWGALALADVEEIDNPLRFQGQYHDAETGLHYNRHRYYDPEVGRYIHQDPIGLTGGANPYRYAPNPVGWIDPLGLTGKDCGVATTISTPYGPAVQGQKAAALAARKEVEEGATLYRIGTMGKSETAQAQFWSLEHPLSPGYAQRYGIPAENVAKANFIETATLKPGTPFVTRSAPGVGANPGGGVEVVVPSGGVQMKGFSAGLD